MDEGVRSFMRIGLNISGGLLKKNNTSYQDPKDYRGVRNNKGRMQGQLKVNGKDIRLDNQIDQTRQIEQDNKRIQSTNMQEAVERIKEAFLGEDSEERYKQVLMKAENGEELSQKDLEYLKSKNPKLYYEIKSEEMVQKQFEERLKHCKTKEEANDVYIMTTNSAMKMCGLKGNTGVKPNKMKFKRLMKRINRVWEQYKKGKLGKKKKVEDVCEKEGNLIKQKLEAFDKFQVIESYVQLYNEQM